MTSEPSDLYAALARLAVTMERIAEELRSNMVSVLESRTLQASLAAIAAQMEPYAPLLERMTLSEPQKSRAYQCSRHHTRLPAGCLCPLCLDDGCHNAGLSGREEYES